MTDYDTIGALRDALSSQDADALVFINNRPPTALSSYRGFYNHLAIERDGNGHDATELDDRGNPFETYSPGHGEVRIKSEPTVADLIAALDLADGEEFEGYKGGQFYMDGSTDLWVSEYGNCDSLRVTALEALPGRVDLLATEVDW